MRKITDQEYVEGIGAGNRQVLDNTYQQFYPRIERFIIKNQGTQEEARDIFQEAMVIVFRKVNTRGFELTSSFFTYLYAICRNLWLKHLRDRQPGVTISEELEYTTVIDEPDEEDAAKETLYREKFKELGDDCQKVLRLFFNKMSMEQIMEQMGYSSIAYTKKRKYLCKERLINAIRNDTRYKNITFDE